jgi:hypothetical protein
MAIIVVDTTHVRQSEVHEGYVRPVLTKLPDGVAAAGCLGHQLHVRLTVDNGSNRLVEQRMIINAENSNFRGLAHLSRPLFTF